MPAGTIALTNNSATVTGSGTSFTTELKVNDFVVSTVGGVAYTLGVKSIESNTSLTLMEIYTGPSASGQSWTPVPYGTMTAITAQLAAQVTYAVRGFNLDKANWQQIFNGSGTVTVILPDGTSWQGPAWSGISTALNGKLDKSENLNDLADKPTARSNLGLGELATLNGPLAINKGGTGTATPFGSSANTFAQGNDSRLNTVNNKSGGSISSPISVNVAANATVAVQMNGPAPGGSTGTEYQGPSLYSTMTGGVGFGYFSAVTPGVDTYGVLTLGISNTFKRWHFLSSGNASAQNGSWVNGSDENIKDDLQVIGDALEKVKSLTGYTGNRDGTRFTGVIAQDVQKVLPEAVCSMGNYVLQTDINGRKKGDVISDALAVAYGDMAGLFIEAIKNLAEKYDECESKSALQDGIIDELLKRMKSIDGLDS